MNEQANTQVKIANILIEKCKIKLRAHPDAPANYVIDQALRNYLEQ